MLAYLLVCTVALSAVYALPEYRDRIPNGYNVLHPCTNNTQWMGVGHINKGGSGERNPFGEHFAEAGHRWTVQLCERDSDEDGLTNGQELGDPDCVWQEGEAVDPTYTVTHPGICDPVSSPACREHQHSISCDGDIGYECPGLDAPDVQVAEFRFPRSNVPAQETTYYCKVFEAPNDQDYHAIAFEPIVDNINVLHHMILYGCDETIEHETEPDTCEMSYASCESMIALWTVGIDGYCLRQDVGMVFGSSVYRYMSLQLHWNNPHARSDYYDSSGMRMFYTHQLREFNENIAMMGQTDLTIPPLSSDVTVQGTCPSKCMETMPHPVNVTQAILHMHYLGDGGRVDLYRGGEFYMTVLEDRYYDYENPVSHVFDPPLVLLPGDEIKTTCRFNSLDGTRRRENTVYYGDGTQEEMCYSFFFFYPGFPEFDCVQHGTYQPCEEECDYEEVGTRLYSTMWYLFTTGICSDVDDEGTCSDSCYSVTSPLLRDSCFRVLLFFLESSEEAMADESFQAMLRIVEQCDERKQDEQDGSDSKDSDNDSKNDSRDGGDSTSCETCGSSYAYMSSLLILLCLFATSLLH